MDCNWEDRFCFCQILDVMREIFWIFFRYEIRFGKKIYRVSHRIRVHNRNCDRTTPGCRCTQPIICNWGITSKKSANNRVAALSPLLSLKSMNQKVVEETTSPHVKQNMYTIEYRIYDLFKFTCLWLLTYLVTVIYI